MLMLYFVGTAVPTNILVEHRSKECPDLSGCCLRCQNLTDKFPIISQIPLIFRTHSYCTIISVPINHFHSAQTQCFQHVTLELLMAGNEKIEQTLRSHFWQWLLSYAPPPFPPLTLFTGHLLSFCSLLTSLPPTLGFLITLLHLQHIRKFTSNTTAWHFSHILWPFVSLWVDWRRWGGLSHRGIFIIPFLFHHSGLISVI